MIEEGCLGKIENQRKEKKKGGKGVQNTNINNDNSWINVFLLPFPIYWAMESSQLTNSHFPFPTSAVAVQSQPPNLLFPPMHPHPHCPTRVGGVLPPCSSFLFRFFAPALQYIGAGDPFLPLPYFDTAHMLLLCKKTNKKNTRKSMIPKPIVPH